MEFLSQVANQLATGRLGANLIAAHGLLTIVVLVSLVLRRLVTRGGSRLGGWTGMRWLEAAGEEAARRARQALFWLTLAVAACVVLASIGYHASGRDARVDLEFWYHQLTVAQLFHLGLRAVAFLGILVANWFAQRAVDRWWPGFELRMQAWLGTASKELVLRHWFFLARLYTRAAVRLLAFWGLGVAVGLSEISWTVFGFLLRVMTILVVARLLTLSIRILTHNLLQLGDRFLRTGPFRHYWERVERLTPFGERCFDAAIWVTAAALGVGVLHFLQAVADYGPAVVKCIGIFFTTRVLIELLQVLLSEAFGLYGDEESVDQKARTLVPLLASVCQYVLYFGSGLVMLGVLGVDTRPILAAAGILGLAVGLGAQNLVTDVVSGFFILFENQYLVGDFVQIGDAAGTVEAVGIRLTQVRDNQGKLYIIPNGQIKGVVSYSKGYVNAVVDLRVPSGSDLEGVIRAMTEAGQRLRQSHAEVLSETHVQGLVDLSTTDMTLRAVTRVRPGAHAAMQNAYRRYLKQALDQHQTAGNRSALAA